MTALASDSSVPPGRGYFVVAGDDDDQELEADAVPPNASASSPGESETSDPDTAVTGCTSSLLEEIPYQDQGIITWKQILFVSFIVCTIMLYISPYYATCALGGLLACGLTHSMVTPLDLFKVRYQVDKNLYKSSADAWFKIIKNEGGFKALYTGVGATLVAYAIQGAAKYGLYKYFKGTYSDMAGPGDAAKYQHIIFLASAALAEFFADILLVPLETVKVRMQTTFSPFASGVLSGVNAVIFKDGPRAMKFWAFETTVAIFYASLGSPKDEYSKLQQLGVSAAAGYIAGVFCAIVSRPADTMVSKLNAPGIIGVAKPTVRFICREIGFGGLWTGLGTRIIMIGTLTALQWLIYDTFKVAMGIPTIGSVVQEEN